MLFKGSPWLPNRIVEIFEEIPKIILFLVRNNIVYWVAIGVDRAYLIYIQIALHHDMRATPISFLFCVIFYTCERNKPLSDLS